MTAIVPLRDGVSISVKERVGARGWGRGLGLDDEN